LAIGKEGQNVRLAAKLCGWKIDIKSHSQFFPDFDEGEEGFEVEDQGEEEYYEDNESFDSEETIDGEEK